MPSNYNDLEYDFELEESLKEEWVRIASQDSQRGERFYEEMILPQIIAKVRYLAKKNGILDELGDANGMIVLVGTSYEPLVIPIVVLRPKKLFFLYTQETENILKKVFEFCKLDITKVKHEQIPSTATVNDVYKLVKKAIIDYFKTSRRVVINVTGGKKSMVFAGAIASAIHNITAIYVDNKGYDPKLRKPRPFTEFIVKLPNPLSITFDDRIKSILEKMDKFAFSAVYEETKELMDQANDPRIFEVYNLFSNAYYYWTIFDHNSALNKFKQALAKIEQYGFKLDPTGSYYLNNNISVVRKIAEIKLQYKDESEFLKDNTAVKYLVVDLFRASERAEKLGRYDLAVLLLYRAAETLVQHGLLKIGIDPKEPNYDALSKELNMSLQALCQVFGKERRDILETEDKSSTAVRVSQLPVKIGLLDGLILLKITKQSFIDEIDLKKIYSALETRNRSIFAHGIKPLTEQTSRKAISIFRKTVMSVYSKLWNDWKKLYESFKFPGSKLKIVA